MGHFDLPLEQLQEYRPEVYKPADFDAFWQETLSATKKHDLNATFQPIESGLKTIEAFDVTFNGYGGQPIKGWFLLPRERKGTLPCVVEFIGYGGGRGVLIDWLLWASVGYAHFVMDTRGQGSSWRTGDTPDIAEAGDTPYYPGFMTRGILDPKHYYYRRVFSDAVRAVEAAQSNDYVDASRIAVTGGSQGGGIALAAAALSPEVGVAMPDVPFLCHYRRATVITDKAPYSEISTYCRTHRHKIDRVFETLSYFDGVNLAPYAKAKALFSVGLMDDICPPSTVFAAYNQYAGEKQIKVYSYNNHEGGENFQQIEKMHFLKEIWGV